MSKYGRDYNYYYSQENNPHEQLLTFIVNKFKDGIDEILFNHLKNELHLLWILETCGPTAMVNCIAALMGDDVNKWPGLQPEGIVMNYFLSPENWPGNDYTKTLPNRIMANYPMVAKKLFNIFAVNMGMNYDAVIGNLSYGHTIQALLRSPSHYIAMVDYDDKNDLIIYNDSYPSRFPDGKGFNKTMNKKEFNNNVVNEFVVYYAS